MKAIFKILALCAVLIIPWNINAQDLSGENGYVDFGNLTGIYGEPRVQINLGATMLGFVSAAAQAEEPEIADIFDKLKSVRVLVFDIEGSADDALATVDRVTNDIQKEGWETIVSVNEEREKVRIYAKITNNVIDGLVVMAVDEDGIDDGNRRDQPEAVFINIIGEIDPEQVGRVTRSLNIDVDVTP